MSESPDVNACVREALDALTSRPDRDRVSGRFTAGTLAAGTTLARSEQMWSALAPLKADLVATVETDLAASDAAETKRGLIDGYAEARLLRAAMFNRLVDLGGPITSKGRQRALYTAYLGALDRETKLATTLGLERRAKPAQSLAEVLAAHEDEVTDLAPIEARSNDQHAPIGAVSVASSIDPSTEDETASIHAVSKDGANG
jgi:hypothetical protein